MLPLSSNPQGPTETSEWRRKQGSNEGQAIPQAPWLQVSQPTGGGVEGKDREDREFKESKMLKF